MYTLQTKMDTWNLVKIFKSRFNLVRRPIISSPRIIVLKKEKENGELATKKRIIDAKSENNLAGLEVIKTTLLQWKEENDKIFTDYKTKEMVLNDVKPNNELCQSVFLEASSNVNVVENNFDISTSIRELDSEVNGIRIEEKIDLTNIQLIRQVSVRRFERTNSFRALGKVLIKNDTKKENIDSF